MDRVRSAVVEDLAGLSAVERDAQQRFIDVGMHVIAEGMVCAAEFLRAQLERGLLWVAGDPPVGFAVAAQIDDALLLAELSVARSAGRRGIGAALIDAVVREASARRLSHVVLSTFREVPWNAPLYRRLGFEEIPEDEVGPALARIRAAEGARLDLTARILMRRPTGR